MFPAEALAQELLARGCRVVLVTDRRGRAFGDKLSEVRVHRVHAGNPVRAGVLALFERDYTAPKADGALRLLITGGSQGARIFADVVPPALASLPGEMKARLEINHQCRPEDIERTALSYSDAGVRYEVAAFFNDMPARLGRAHLAICRAGASTCAELTVAGVPAILVPYPHPPH